MRAFLMILCLIWTATTAQSGAWAREKGQLFLSSGANLWVSDGTEVPMYYDTTIYGEYGLTDLVTIGLDYFTTDRDTVQNGFVFAQFPLGDTSKPDRFAASLAFGARSDLQTFVDRLVRGGLSWGRGLNNGWLAVDASATYSETDEVFRPKADFTLGHNLSDSWTVIIQLQTGEGFNDGKFIKVSPAIIYGITDNLRVSLSAVQPLTGIEESAIRLSFWSSY